MDMRGIHSLRVLLRVNEINRISDIIHTPVFYNPICVFSRIIVLGFMVNLRGY